MCRSLNVKSLSNVRISYTPFRAVTRKKQNAWPGFTHFGSMWTWYSLIQHFRNCCDILPWLTPTINDLSGACRMYSVRDLFKLAVSIPKCTMFCTLHDDVAVTTITPSGTVTGQVTLLFLVLMNAVWKLSLRLEVSSIPLTSMLQMSAAKIGNSYGSYFNVII